ncbi:hypothetical protein [Tateyamaria sp. syn59]|uniref:hypothetical protein n=1 Tax=Tateyamaria sp. syn59 TaxID=2576942 RepID=UPI0011BDF43D|nr:hypothetical protein [Tateyamaria sp. syn59]
MTTPDPVFNSVALVARSDALMRSSMEAIVMSQQACAVAERLREELGYECLGADVLHPTLRQWAGQS